MFGYSQQGRISILPATLYKNCLYCISVSRLGIQKYGIWIVYHTVTNHQSDKTPETASKKIVKIKFVMNNYIIAIFEGKSACDSESYLKDFFKRTKIQ